MKMPENFINCKDAEQIIWGRDNSASETIMYSGDRRNEAEDEDNIVLW